MQTAKEILDRFIVFNQFKNTALEFKVVWSERLSLYMVITEEEIIFQDGVSYSLEELSKLGIISDQMLEIYHAAKKIFISDLKLVG